MIKKEYIKTEPVFFRMISYSGFALFVFIFLVSFFVEAPLDVKADIITPPNPAKASWFLIWIQEVVSYYSYLIYLVIFVFIYYLFLPYI